MAFIDGKEAPMKYVSPYSKVKNLFVVATGEGEVWAKIRYSDLEHFLQLTLSGVDVDEEWYRATYPDIDQAILDGLLPNARAHFVTSGYFEGRLPCLMAVDETWYLETYEDIQAAVNDGIFESASDHFHKFGYREGRFPGPMF